MKTETKDLKFDTYYWAKYVDDSRNVYKWEIVMTCSSKDRSIPDLIYSCGCGDAAYAERFVFGPEVIIPEGMV